MPILLKLKVLPQTRFLKPLYFMGIWTEAAEACNKIRKESANRSYKVTDELGLMEALFSQENLDAGQGEITIQEFNSSEGRRITVYENTYQRDEPSDVSVGVNPSYCTPVADQAKYTRSVSFALADRYEKKFTISNDIFRGYCAGETKGNFIRDKIRNAANAIFMKMEQNFPLQFLTQRGTLVGGGLIATGELFNTNVPVATNNGFLADVKRAARNMELRNGLFVVGDGIIADFSDLESTSLLCCNNSGYQLDDTFRKTGLMYYRSPNVQIAMGANVNDVMIWGAGAVLPVYWIKNKGQFDTLSTKEQRSAEEYQGIDTNIVVNIGGTDKNMLMDLSVRFDNCGNDAQWTFTLSCYAKLDMEIATETFQAGSRLFGTNGAFLGRPTSV